MPPVAIQRSAQPSAVTLICRSLPSRSAAKGVLPPSDPFPPTKKCHFVKPSRSLSIRVTANNCLRLSDASAKKLLISNESQP